MDNRALQAERINVDDDLWAANDFFEEKGWTDGLPIIPPTEERVLQMLAAAERNPQDVIGTVKAEEVNKRGDAAFGELLETLIEPAQRKASGA